MTGLYIGNTLNGLQSCLRICSEICIVSAMSVLAVVSVQKFASWGVSASTINTLIGTATDVSLAWLVSTPVPKWQYSSISLNRIPMQDTEMNISGLWRS